MVKYKKAEEPALTMNVPMVSAVMQTVSGEKTGIGLAKEGGAHDVLLKDTASSNNGSPNSIKPVRRQISGRVFHLLLSLPNTAENDPHKRPHQHCQEVEMQDHPQDQIPTNDDLAGSLTAQHPNQQKSRPQESEIPFPLHKALDPKAHQQASPKNPAQRTVKRDGNRMRSHLKTFHDCRFHSLPLSMFSRFHEALFHQPRQYAAAVFIIRPNRGKIVILHHKVII